MKSAYYTLHDPAPYRANYLADMQFSNNTMHIQFRIIVNNIANMDYYI